MRILVGSQALSQHLPDITPKDTDYFSDTPIKNAETFYHHDLEKYSWNNPTASLDELYTIKVSHSFWVLKNNSWVKHMKHLIRMQQAGAELIPELYDILYPIWEERYGKKKANLSQDPEDFFNKNVKRIYVHDSIHAAVAYYSEPLFTQILRDGHHVAVSKDKFDALSHQDKIRLVHEEVFVTALERQVIARQGARYAQGYRWALQELITSYSKGWFPLWIVQNFSELIEPPFDYYEKMMDNSDKLIPITS